MKSIFVLCSRITILIVKIPAIYLNLNDLYKHKYGFYLNDSCKLWPDSWRASTCCAVKTVNNVRTCTYIAKYPLKTFNQQLKLTSNLHICNLNNWIILYIHTPLCFSTIRLSVFNSKSLAGIFVIYWLINLLSVSMVIIYSGDIIQIRNF